MKLCRFEGPGGGPRVGLLVGESGICDLTAAGVMDLTTLLEADDPASEVSRLAGPGVLPVQALGGVRLLSPVERQEVWAAGVTYLRSKAARMDESEFSATAYDRVYEAERPEVFFKASPGKVVGPGEAIGVRADSRWTVPEPELALVFNSKGRVAGYTAGNDVSARDIEGENLLYLPQAKIYDRSCALGPWVVVGCGEAEVREWEVELEVDRAGVRVFQGTTGVGRIRRSFGELGSWLFRSQRFPAGVVLLTGTGIVPPDEFSLQPGDEVVVGISGVGRLKNPVIAV